MARRLRRLRSIAVLVALAPLAVAWLGPSARTPRVARRAADAAVVNPGEAVGRWWNETYEFWEALEIWNAPSLQEDKRSEAVELSQLLQKVNATALKANAQTGVAKTQTREDLSKLLELLPAVTLAYYRMRFTSVFDKAPVKRGLSSTAVYANLALLAVFVRVVAPRLLAADNLDEFFEAVQPLGVPDRASLMGILQSIAAYDTATKVGLYVLAFVAEKLFMLTEFLPIQIALKTMAPIIFGGLVQGAIASAATETLAAASNFLIGRSFLADGLRGFSVFGSEPVGKASWFHSLERAAQEDGARLTLLLRLAPVLPLPFDSYWYLLGALDVGLGEFAVAHFAGCLKTAFLDASFGMLLLTSVGNDGSAVQSQAQQIVLVESVAFAVVAVLVSTVATRLINELLGLDKDAKDESKESARPVD
ncbi:CPK1 [Symbiodinium pilosum]|uniref:CPK1 protein n=1 Tax=Symbiodinium pilosum TaxID=2952 RepID=A0A812NV55_SYMPI|nr:CPK1 [Symbiodinium pilosum]